MENFAGAVLVTLVMAFAGIGVGSLIGDYRSFNTITAQCKEQGYIQDKTTRIHCIVEDKK